MAPLVLPWTFVMLDCGVRDFKNKLNAVGNFLFFFMGLVFPIYYLFELLQDKENELIKARREDKMKI
jgi:hypothetical protein